MEEVKEPVNLQQIKKDLEALLDEMEKTPFTTLDNVKQYFYLNFLFTEIFFDVSEKNIVLEKEDFFASVFDRFFSFSNQKKMVKALKILLPNYSTSLKETEELIRYAAPLFRGGKENLKEEEEIKLRKEFQDIFFNFLKTLNTDGVRKAFFVYKFFLKEKEFIINEENIKEIFLAIAKANLAVEENNLGESEMVNFVRSLFYEKEFTDSLFSFFDKKSPEYVQGLIKSFLEEVVVSKKKNNEKQLSQQKKIYEKVEKIKETVLKSNPYVKNKNMDSVIKDFYMTIFQDKKEAQSKSLNIFILSMVLSMAEFTGKISPEFRKETVMKILKETEEANINEHFLIKLIEFDNSPVMNLSFEKLNKKGMLHFLEFIKNNLLNLYEINSLIKEGGNFKLMDNICSFKLKKAGEKAEEPTEEKEERIRAALTEYQNLINLISLWEKGLKGEFGIADLKKLSYLENENYSYGSGYSTRNRYSSIKYLFFKNPFFFLKDQTGFLRNVFFLDKIRKKELFRNEKETFILNVLRTITAYLKNPRYKEIDLKTFIELVREGRGNNYIFSALNPEDGETIEGIYYFVRNFLKRIGNDIEIYSHIFSLKDKELSLLLITIGKMYFPVYSRDTDLFNVLECLPDNLDYLVSKEITEYQKNLFNFSFVFDLAKENDLYTESPETYQKLLKIAEKKDLFLNALIIKNFIFGTLLQYTNPTYTTSNMKNSLRLKKGELVPMEDFLKKISVLFKKSLLKREDHTKNILNVGKVLESLKIPICFFENGSKKYVLDHFFPMPDIQMQNLKLYQAKILKNFNQIIVDIFINGITLTGEKELEFITKYSPFLTEEKHRFSFFEGIQKITAFNEWVKKTGFIEDILIKRGVLSLIVYSTLKERTFFNNLEEDLKSFLEENTEKSFSVLLAESFKNLPKNFVVVPAAISAENFEKNTKEMAKSLITDTLFGIDMNRGINKEMDNKEILEKLKITNFFGMFKMKKTFKNSGIELKVEKKEKGQELAQSAETIAIYGDDVRRN